MEVTLKRARMPVVNTELVTVSISDRRGPAVNLFIHPHQDGALLEIVDLREGVEKGELEVYKPGQARFCFRGID